MKNEFRYEPVFLNENAIGSFNERQGKLVSEWFGMSKNDGVACVSIVGGLYSMDYDFLSAQLEAIEKDDEVKSVVLHINSPGGAVAGLFDCCDYIKSMKKPITAYISGMACSAAYAIASSCGKVYAQQDSQTGCCGCYAHPVEPDYKSLGLLHRVFRSKNAPRKNVSCVTDEKEAEAYQSEIDQLGDKYLAYVAANRGVDVETAEKTFGQGASVSAMYALANGMIDGICTIEDACKPREESVCEPNEETTSCSQSESEGEDMDITSMSAEERRELFNALCEAEPSLVSERVEEAKRIENERVCGLNALRNGTDAVNVIVDAAVEQGKCANDIALDVIKAMRENPAPTHEEERKASLEGLVNDTTPVATPLVKSEDQLIEEMVGRM